MEDLLSAYNALVTYAWTLVRVYMWLRSVLSLLATQQLDYEKLLLESEPLLSAEEHTWRYFCLCEKYQQLIGLEEIQKIHF